MEGNSGILSRIDSVNANSSTTPNIWSNNSIEIFSSSVREDDEEALKWAAIERLPSYLRRRTTILTNAEGKAIEVDVKNLSFAERKILLERLVKIAEEDHEKFLLRQKERFNR